MTDESAKALSAQESGAKKSDLRIEIHVNCWFTVITTIQLKCIINQMIFLLKFFKETPHSEVRINADARIESDARRKTKISLKSRFTTVNFNMM
jgi:hypothetical protein